MKGFKGARLLAVGLVIYPVVFTFATVSWLVGDRGGESYIDRLAPVTAGYFASLAIIYVVEAVAAAITGARSRREERSRARSTQRCGKDWGHFAHYWNASPVARYWCDGERSEET